MNQSINRRHFLRLSAITSMGCLLPGCKHNIDKIGQRPNVLFISVDDLNNWIEPLGGHPQAKTPHLMRFANESVNFTNAYCASPSCNPSRTALLTGKHPHITGLYSNPQIWRHVLPDEITLPEYFRSAGYWVGGSGKIFHNNMPDPRSWDDYFPSKIQHMPEYYLPDYDSTSNSTYFRKTDNEIREDDPKGITFNMPPFDKMYIAFDFEPLPFRTEQTGDYSAVNWVSHQLKRKHGQPFFLACGIYRPHLPWYVPQKYFDRFPLEQVQLPSVYQNDWDDLPDAARRIASQGNYHKHVTKAGLWKHAVQGYLASINYADDLVGHLLQTLRESAYADNTIVVIYSDHGWQLGEKRHWRKFALWQNVINTVLMIKVPPGLTDLPSGSQNGAVCQRNVSLVDIFPTLTELCGLKPKNGVTGQNLMPLLHNPSAQWDYPVITSLSDIHYSVIYNKWHYINYDGTEEELYDMHEDPDEWNNLASLESSDEIKRQLKAWIPQKRREYVRTAPIRWADVLNGKISFDK